MPVSTSLAECPRRPALGTAKAHAISTLGYSKSGGTTSVQSPKTSGSVSSRPWSRSRNQANADSASMTAPVGTVIASDASARTTTIINAKDSTAERPNGVEGTMLGWSPRRR